MFIDYGHQVLESFEEIEHSLNRLCLHIHDEIAHLPIWISNGKSFENNRDKLIYVLKHFGPTSGLSPQETYSCPGAVAGTAATLELVQQVNSAKDHFKSITEACRKEMGESSLRFVRETLSRAGYTPIKLKQVYRHIPNIDYHPRRIAWTQGKHSLSQKINKNQAKEMLLKVGKGEHIDIQLSKLSLVDNKTTLVIYREIKSCWIANISTYKSGSRSLNKDIRTSLPIFYLINPELTDPEICFSSKFPRKVKHRADKKVEDKVFLSSISAYRYLK